MQMWPYVRDQYCKNNERIHEYSTFLFKIIFFLCGFEKKKSLSEFSNTTFVF